MKFEDFTKEQQHAITADGSNIIVSAGAGSGKTAVLTQRVLHFIENKGYHLDEFLILTFTKLAAGEMKERIRSALEEKGLDDASIVDICDITTFDAYALSVVKKYHSLLNVSSNVSIIDSNIIAVKKRKIIDEIFHSQYTLKNTTFIDMVKTFCFKDDAMLQEQVLRLHNGATLELDFDEYLNTFINKYYNENIILSYMDFYLERMFKDREKVKEYIKYLPDVQLSSKDTRTYKEAIEEELNLYFNASCYDDFVSSIENINIPTKPRGLDKEISKIISEFKDCVNEALELINSLPRSKREFLDYFNNLKPYISLLISFTKDVESRLQEYKKQNNVYEFQDIAKMALQLLRSNDEVRNEIKNKLKMIMIDEYQDTSLLQEKFIEQIASDNVYMVGDIKQSIYRFRNAKSDIFKDKYSKYSNNDGGIAIDLNKNFRSRGEVLDDINYMFQQLMSLDMGGADYLKSHIIDFGNTAYVTKGYTGNNNNSSFIIYPNDNDSIKRYGINKATIEAELIAKDIIHKINAGYSVFDKKRGTRACDFSDFCILMDRGSEFDTYVKVFNDYHIPLFVENDENISNNTVINVLTNLVRFIKAIKENDYSSKEFIHAYLSIARSFIFKYSDNDLYKICTNKSFKDDYVTETIRNIIIKNSDCSMYQLMTTIVFELNIYNSFISIGDVKKNESYLDAFLDVFKQMCELDYSLEEFLLYLKYIDEYNLKINIPSGGSSINSVRLMNIHKSKGLEFPIVYFSGLNKTFNREDLKNKYGLSSMYGLYFAPRGDKLNILQDLNKIYESYEDTSEKIRLFYVALTRAKEKMIFVMPSNEYSHIKYLKDYSFILDYKKQDIEDIFIDFLNQKISYTVLLMICKRLNIKLPISFLNCKLEDKFNYSIEQLHKELSIQKEIINKIHNLFYKVKEDTLEVDELIAYIESNKLETIFNISILKGNLEEKEWEDVCSPYYSNYIVTIDDVFESYSRGYIDYDELIDCATNLVGELSPAFYEEDIDTWDDIFINRAKYSYDDLVTFIINVIYNASCHKINAHEKLRELGLELNIELYNNILKNYPDSSRRDIITKYIYNLANVKDKIELFNKYVYKDEAYPGETCINELIEYFKEGNILTSTLEQKLDIYNVMLKVGFKKQSLEDQRNVNSIDDIIIEKGNLIKDRESMVKLIDFVAPFMKYRKFNIIAAELEMFNESLNITTNKHRESYIIKEHKIKPEIIHMNKASKTINIDASKKNLDFGSNIHYLLEIIDFKSPDFSLVNNDLYKDIIDKFLSSKIMLNISNGNIFKEYEFIDDDIRGIIDLLVLYEDHVDIIDYKTKNIDDDEYEKQLKTYRKYISNKTSLPINCYIYSLLTGEYKEVL